MVAQLLCYDIKNFYLVTPMDWYEYTCLSVNLLPEERISQYGLRNISHNGYIYAEIRRIICGLPQDVTIADNHLKKT